jgi:kynurenine formamidase
MRSPDMNTIDLSHTIEHGMITYRGQPACGSPSID